MLQKERVSGECFFDKRVMKMASNSNVIAAVFEHLFRERVKAPCLIEVSLQDSKPVSPRLEAVASRQLGREIISDEILRDDFRPNESRSDERVQGILRDEAEDVLEHRKIEPQDVVTDHDIRLPKDLNRFLQSIWAKALRPVSVEGDADAMHGSEVAQVEPILAVVRFNVEVCDAYHGFLLCVSSSSTLPTKPGRAQSSTWRSQEQRS